MKKINSLLILALVILFACNKEEDGAIAYGNFEANEVFVSAKTNGQLNAFSIDKGMNLKAGQQVGFIDSSIFSLQKEQIRAKINSLNSKIAEAKAGIKVLQSKHANLQKDKERVDKLLLKEAATQREADHLATEVQITGDQISQAKQSIQSIKQEQKVLDKQIKLLDKQLNDCRIINPIDGVVLEKYFENSEICMAGKPLYKIAALDELELKAYIDEPGLSEISPGMAVHVAIDGPDSKLVFYPGTITWISSEAEFTPKIIQTRNERVNQVYAFKVKVKNDGKLKIGLPAEVHLRETENKE